jgi:hypothetical protein
MLTGYMAITAGKPSKQWGQLQNEVLQEESDPEASVTHLPSNFKTANEKFLHAQAYIANFLESSMVDTSPEVNQEDTKYIPYKKICHFFAEYMYECDEKSVPKHVRAGESTFRKAFNLLRQEKGIKLSSGKGD